MRENLYRLAFLVLCVIVALICATNAFGQTLTITPSNCLAPCDVRVELRIERDKANRWWSLSYTGPEEGVSGGSMEGEDAEGVFPVCTTNLRPCFRTLRSEGTYFFVGCVHKLVGDKLKAFCSDKAVNVREPWRRIALVCSAEGCSAPTVTLALHSVSRIDEEAVGTSTFVRNASVPSMRTSRIRFGVPDYHHSTRLGRRKNETAQPHPLSLRALPQRDD